MELETLLDYVFSYQVILLVLIVVGLKSSIKFVPQNRAFIIERFGKYNTTLEARFKLHCALYRYGCSQSFVERTSW